MTEVTSWKHLVHSYGRWLALNHHSPPHPSPFPPLLPSSPPSPQRGGEFQGEAKALQTKLASQEGRLGCAGAEPGTSGRVGWLPITVTHCAPPPQAGGCKAGTFDPYPKHSEDPYPSSASGKADKGGTEKKIFRPSQGPKSTPTNSVIAQNVQRSVGRRWWREGVVGWEWV